MNLVLNAVGVAVLYAAARMSMSEIDAVFILSVILGLIGGSLYGATVMNLYLAARRNGVR